LSLDTKMILKDLKP